MRPFFSFYGGKWRDTPKHFPSPEFETIVEPFAGSAGYSVRYPDHDVVLCDIDPIIASVWQYLIEVKPDEILSLPGLQPGQTVDDLAVPQEARWLIGFWLNKGAERPRKSPSQWMREDNQPECYWGNRVRTTIASQVESIRHWRIYNCSYEDCPVTEVATWFVDPPYQHAGRHYRFGSKLIDYASLGRWCKELPGQVVVCEQQGATWLPFRTLGDVKTSRTSRSVEMLCLL